jgi:aspartyl/asparaginyl beta-hydroxylase (cupin superfamily)
VDDIKLPLGERLLGKAFHRHSLLGDKMYFDPYVFPIAKELEDLYPEIKLEVERILARYDDLVVFQDVSPNQAYIPTDDKWRMFFYRAMGVNFKQNQTFAPVVSNLIKKYPEIVSAYISVLGPKTYLNPHKGPWSGILRMHLGVVIPKNGYCALIVEGVDHVWEEGKTVLFDDTYEHTAVNATDEKRAIVFLDIMRPLPQPWKFLNWLATKLSLLTPYIISAYWRHRIWQGSFFR